MNENTRLNAIPVVDLEDAAHNAGLTPTITAGFDLNTVQHTEMAIDNALEDLEGRRGGDADGALLPVLDSFSVYWDASKDAYVIHKPLVYQWDGYTLRQVGVKCPETLDYGDWFCKITSPDGIEIVAELVDDATEKNSVLVAKLTKNANPELIQYHTGALIVGGFGDESFSSSWVSSSMFSSSSSSPSSSGSSSGSSSDSSSGSSSNSSSGSSSNSSSGFSSNSSSGSSSDSSGESSRSFSGSSSDSSRGSSSKSSSGPSSKASSAHSSSTHSSSTHSSSTHSSGGHSGGEESGSTVDVVVSVHYSNGELYYYTKSVQIVGEVGAQEKHTITTAVPHCCE